MKALFICSALEEGKDGVGDYTRGLAANLIKKENEARIIAYNDRFVSDLWIGEQFYANVPVPVYRVPESSTYNFKQKIIKEYIDQFSPEWISFQFVPYGFQKKGFPVSVFWMLNELRKSQRIHFMFHEIWVGISNISAVKHKIIGLIQKINILIHLKLIKPDLITTTNKLYEIVLRQSGVLSTIIPLFSNIPKAELKADIIDRLCAIFNSIDLSTLKNDYYVAGIFGDIYRSSMLNNTLLTCINEAQKVNRKFVLLHFGKISTYGDNELRRLQIKFKGEIIFIDLGELHADEVSTVLQILDVGIPLTPTEHLAKSGVYSAMKLHDVHVLFPETVYSPEFKDEVIKFIEDYNARPSYMWDVDFVADKFLEIINKNEK